MNPNGKSIHKGTPKGFSARDAYMARMHAITTEVTNQAENFMDTSRLISLSSSAGIVLSKKRSQSGSDTVKLLGCIVTSDPVKPSEKFLGANRDSPRPSDSTGIRP